MYKMSGSNKASGLPSFLYGSVSSFYPVSKSWNGPQNIPTNEWSESPFILQMTGCVGYCRHVMWWSLDKSLTDQRTVEMFY